MKFLEYVVWIVGILAAVLIILGAIAFFFNVRILGINHVVNYYHVASSLLLLDICLILYLKWKEEKD